MRWVSKSGMGLAACLLWVAALSARAQETDWRKARDLFDAGKYEEVVEMSRAALEGRGWQEEWRIYLTRALWTLGRYPEAAEAVRAATRENRYSLRLWVEAFPVLQSAGEERQALEALEAINSVGGSRRFSLRDPETVVALGRGALLIGAEPKRVLENLLEPARKADPKLLEAHLAIGNLALEKRDFAMAAKVFQAALKEHPDHPDLTFGLAAAFENTDREKMGELLRATLKKNSRHLDALLLLANHQIDSEDYPAARRTLADVLKVNPHRPEAWALLSALEHLASKPEPEAEARGKALAFWTRNPLVDNIIGQKLSQKYRFLEGAAAQKRALAFDPTHQPSQIQLAQDLLRLGDEEEEGWRLASKVFEADEYNVAAFNLVTLKETLGSFTTLTNDHFQLRMHPREAPVFGGRALELLERARADLTARYACELSKRVNVEMFPDQKDFAVRTFGMPGGEGFLAVCFGHVITANSPASATVGPMNWEAMLWHEFAHVVTLQLTKNKMPRWLSEGISVYEERRANPLWGEKLLPEYRELIRKGEYQPIENFNAAFSEAPSPMHVQFAYYHASLVVEHILEEFGQEALRHILTDLGEGVEINTAIAARTTDLKALQKSLDQRMKAAAERLGTDLQWAKPEREPNGAISTVWAALHKENYHVLMEKAGELVEEGKLEEALPALSKALELYPDITSADGPHAELANIHRKLKQPEEELAALRRWTARDAENLEAHLRLLELEIAAGEGRRALQTARRLLAIQPMLPQPWRALAEPLDPESSEGEIVAALENLLRLDPRDQAGLHFRLAQLLSKERPGEARRHLLLSLADAPRNRQAYGLLRELPPTPVADPKPPETLPSAP